MNKAVGATHDLFFQDGTQAQSGGSLGFPVATKLLKKEMKFVFHLLPIVQISER